jgi:hypothetical protein
LRGTQGSFSFFSTKIAEAITKVGSRYPLRQNGNVLEGSLEGPEHPFNSGPALTVRFELAADPDPKARILRVEGKDYRLTRGEYTPWIKLTFRAVIGVSVTGIVRFMLTETDPDVTVLRDARSTRSGKPGVADQPSIILRVRTGEASGHLFDARDGRGYLGAERRHHRRRSFSKAGLISPWRNARRCSSNALEKTRRGEVACVFDTAIACSTCSSSI